MKIINIIFESMGFITLSYLLLCSMSSFKTNPVYIILSATNIVLISRFWKILKDIGINNVAVAIIFIICLVLLFVLFLRFGYLLMTPIRFPLS